jgi:hypothetical protein
MFLASFLPWFMQEMVGSLSRVYRIFARATNSYVFIQPLCNITTG